MAEIGNVLCLDQLPRAHARFAPIGTAMGHAPRCTNGQVPKLSLPIDNVPCTPAMKARLRQLGGRAVLSPLQGQGFPEPETTQVFVSVYLDRLLKGDRRRPSAGSSPSPGISAAMTLKQH
jgi:hypothetical protein